MNTDYIESNQIPNTIVCDAVQVAVELTEDLTAEICIFTADRWLAVEIMSGGISTQAVLDGDTYGAHLVAEAQVTFDELEGIDIADALAGILS